MTQHTWRHVTIWFLHLGVLWLPLLSLTADQNTACKTNAEGKFKIRAMIYTHKFAYLVDSDGQLFVEDKTAFLRGMEQKAPTIKLSKPICTLSTNWHGFEGQVDYADTEIHFGFTNDYPDDSSQDKVTLRMITYKPTDVEGSKLHMCVYNGIQMNGRKAPSNLKEETLCKDIYSIFKPVFWLNDKWTIYPIDLQENGMKMEIVEFSIFKVQEEFLKVSKWNSAISTKIGTFAESNVKPQSELLTEKVLFIASEDSTGYFLSVNKRGDNAEQLPLSKIVKLQFCQVGVGPKGDSIKPTNRIQKEKMIYLVLTGIFIILIALVVYAMINWPKRREKRTRKGKNGEKASEGIGFWSKIRGRMASKVQESRAISLAISLDSDISSHKKKKRRNKKRGKGRKKRDNKRGDKRDKNQSKKGDNQRGNFLGTIGSLLAKVSPFTAKKKKQQKMKELLMSTARDSILLTSMTAAASTASPTSM